MAGGVVTVEAAWLFLYLSTLHGASMTEVKEIVIGSIWFVYQMILRNKS